VAGFSRHDPVVFVERLKTNARRSSPNCHLAIAFTLAEQ